MEDKDHDRKYYFGNKNTLKRKRSQYEPELKIKNQIN